MIKIEKIKITLLAALISVHVSAKENINYPGISNVKNERVAAGCTPSTSQTDLDVNNVRTTIMGGGDMWWNLDDARYEIPKDGNKHSMFAGALWIGGVDAGGQLKVAAMTYRQGGNDFWPGPLDVNTATISPEECEEWDKHFKINRSEVEQFVSDYDNSNGAINQSDIPESVLEWPAHGDVSQGQDYYLAPFYDRNGDGNYNPLAGDYPDYNVTGTNDDSKLYGDQTLFWIFNDKGNIHTESEAEALGLEIHAQAFGFTADNEVNDMTFYNYKIINRSTLPLLDTYFGQWVDPDLGYYLDDYVGCDVGLGLGFCYNGDAEDEGAAGYGFNPPAIGVDFFQGPLADPNDGVDNDRDGTVDEYGEQIIMSKFVYYNNDFTVTGNPSTGTHIYNYLRGIWKDNVPMTYGGDGHGSGQGSTTDLCNFMFPGTSDPDFPGQEWTEVTAGNTPADRRFLQSAGPFTLQPGAVNEITTGVVWARANTGGQTASVQLVKIYDKEAQALFDNNFNILNGPDAPDLEIRELDQELIITLSNKVTSNNYEESYSEKDPYITKPDNLLNSPNYEFQGYLVYQLVDATVSVTDLDNPDKARLVFRSDVKDGVTGIINQYLDPVLGVFTPVEEVSSVLSQGVIGSVDEGTEYSFQILDDKFALGSTKLVNHKTYYFMSIAYGYNQAEENADPYNVNDPNYDGRNQPYIGGRRNIKVYSAIPHNIGPDGGGTQLNSSYGDGVKITRVEGQGNGGLELTMTQGSENAILNGIDYRSSEIEYEAGSGPIEITVVDPVSVVAGTYVLKLDSPQVSNQNFVESYYGWTLEDDNGDIISSSEKSITIGDNQFIDELGLSFKIKQSSNPGADPNNINSNGLISGSVDYDDPNDRWLSGVPDRDDESAFFSLWGLNWIRAGSFTNDNDASLSDYNQTDDPNGVFETVIEKTVTVGFGNFSIDVTGGTWAPYRFASNFNDGPGFNNTVTNSYVKIDKLNSVDVVFTQNKDLWTRCPVVEAQDDPTLSIGGQIKMGLRQSPSVDKDGNPESGVGMGWFPGYAIDVQTGERLNIIFAEDSWLTNENGNDMIWNPTSNIVTSDFPQYDPTAPQGQQFSGGNYLLGGKHFIYILRGESWVKGTEDYISGDYLEVDNCPNYDEGAWAYAQLSDGGLPAQFNVFKHVTWTSVPLLAPGRNLLTTDARVKLRVSKPYKQFESVDPSRFLSKDDDLIVGTNYVVTFKNDQTTWGGFNITHDGTTYKPGQSFVATTTSFTGNSRARVVEGESSNNFNPIYRFSTDDIVAEIGNNSVARSSIDMINVVPNPYYGYSEYETNQLDNRIKITNLPQKATISIFTLSGTLVRTLKKDDSSISSIDWDLKNDYGIPIASGLYVIHVKTNEGEKVLKWFGALRPIDLDTF